MIAYKHGKTIAEKHAEQEEKRKPKQKNQGTRKPLTAEEKKKVEQLRQKIADMNKFNNIYRGMEIR